jgi:hypothetical protein
MADNAPFTSLDFEQAKEDLKTYLKNQDRFKDYDFEGSNMNVLLDVLAYNTFKQGVYNNMAFSEMFLDSVQLRENAVSHAKELNYLPGSNHSPNSILDVTVNVPNPESASSILSIPKGTKFNAQCGSKSYTFITDRNRSVRRVNNSYRITDLQVYEGRQLREFYTVNNSDPVPYVINNENVDTRSVRVFVRENSNINSERVEYIAKNDIFGVTDTDKVFYIEPHFDNLYKVSFGRDRFGAEPPNASVVEIEYRVTKGDEANGARDFTPLGTISGYNATVNAATTAKNGTKRESLEDIKFFAPKSIQIQERAVTVSDYEILLKQRFPNIQTLSVYGGDLATPPQFGKVIISVDVLGSEGAGTSEIQEYKAYLQDKTPLTIEPVFVPAEFLYVNLDISCYYDPRLTTKSSENLEQDIASAITTYSDTYLNKFNATLRQSRLANVIDTTDVSILSTDITSKPIIEYEPTLGATENPIFDFGAQMVKPYAFNGTTGFSSYKPAIESSRFTVEGTLVSLQDDGLGNISAITASSSDRRIFKRNIGTVDYSTGVVRLINFKVDRFEGNAIRIIANTTNKDVNSNKNKILALREQDININMVVVRQ